MHIITNRPQVERISLIDNQRFITTREQVTAETVPPVKPDAVTDIEPLHRLAEVKLARLQQKMIMIVHQHVSMHPHIKSLRHFSDVFQEMMDRVDAQPD